MSRQFNTNVLVLALLAVASRKKTARQLPVVRGQSCAASVWCRLVHCFQVWFGIGCELCMMYVFSTRTKSPGQVFLWWGAGCQSSAPSCCGSKFSVLAPCRGYHVFKFFQCLAGPCWWKRKKQRLWFPKTVGWWSCWTFGYQSAWVLASELLHHSQACLPSLLNVYLVVSYIFVCLSNTYV